MSDTRIARFLGVMISLALLVLAGILYSRHRSETVPELGKYDPATAQEVYQERMVQTRMIMSKLDCR